MTGKLTLPIPKERKQKHFNLAALRLVLVVPMRGWLHGTKRPWRSAALHLVLVDPPRGWFHGTMRPWSTIQLNESILRPMDAEKFTDWNEVSKFGAEKSYDDGVFTMLGAENIA